MSQNIKATTELKCYQSFTWLCTWYILSSTALLPILVCRSSYQMHVRSRQQHTQRRSQENKFVGKCNVHIIAEGRTTSKCQAETRRLIKKTALLLSSCRAHKIQELNLIILHNNVKNTGFTDQIKL